MRNRMLQGLVMAALLASGFAQAGDSDLKTAVGTAVGAAAGAAIGKEVGGKTGAIVGGGVGGAVGGAATTKGAGREGAIIGGAAGGATGAAVAQKSGKSAVAGAAIGGGAGGLIGKNVDEALTPKTQAVAGSTRVVERRTVVEHRYREDDDRRGKRGKKRGKHCDDDHPGRGNAYGKYKNCD